MRKVRFTIERDMAALALQLPRIQGLADSEKEALGFLPAAALEDAIGRQRLFAAMAEFDGASELAGYLLHGGVFPHAKVQQIAVLAKFRKSGVASMLMKSFVIELERIGFMTIKAEVASDLPSALAFYKANGFEFVRQRAGGQARNRTILIHVKQLETDSLFSIGQNQPNGILDLGIRRRSVGDMPIFAFDLNVYFDLVKDRSQSVYARRLFGAALGHDIRLAVADEFVTELRRSSNETMADPILQMALQLPRLPKVDQAELAKMAEWIHHLVFVQKNAKGAGTKQAFSDAQHLAHAALSRASAFVTRDGCILASRNELLSKIGIDVAALDELIALLPSAATTQISKIIQGDGFSINSILIDKFSIYMNEARISSSLISEFSSDSNNLSLMRREAISEDGRIVAVGALMVPKGTEPLARLLVHISSEHADYEMFADCLLDSLVKLACKNSPISVELVHLQGQSSLSSIAAAHGFFRADNNSNYSKVALGRPLVFDNWSKVTQSIRRRTGLTLPSQLPEHCNAQDAFEIVTPAGRSVRLGVGQLEDILSPTVFIWPGRDGVLVPITRAYADDLLGTSRQSSFDFVTYRDAAFFSRRGYVNSPRAAKQMRPDSPILFYESKRTGSGRGAVVAIARIVDSMVVRKDDIPKDDHRRLVVDNIDPFSASEDVLLTTFDNLFVLPQPVPFNKLKEIDAIGRANLISAVSLSGEKIALILTQGWCGGKFQ